MVCMMTHVWTMDCTVVRIVFFLLGTAIILSNQGSYVNKQKPHMLLVITIVLIGGLMLALSLKHKQLAGAHDFYIEYSIKHNCVNDV